MANRVTPFVKRMRTQGGTIYTFSSAVEDIGLNINERNNVVKVSNFALLNIPTINTLNTEPASANNYFNVDAINGAWYYNQTGTNIKDGRILIAESFQNYALNLETLLLSQNNYNATLSNTVSERVFWKWLKETGAIRFTSIDTSAGVKWIEEIDDFETAVGYNNVVKCIGAISAGNVRSDTFGTYNETYVLIPTSYGQTSVYFNQVEDENYYHGQIIPGGTVNISGRESYVLPQPDGLDYKAYYDIMDSSSMCSAYTLQIGAAGFSAGWWFDSISNGYTQSYLIDSSAYIASGNYTDSLRYAGGSAEFSYQRSKVDCLSIIYDLNELKTIYNSTDANFSFDSISLPPNSINDNFDFNAVLIYYSVYNSTMDVKLATNLLGILFLDAPSGNSANIGNTGILIPSITKLQSTAAGFGTSYSLRLNIKTDSLMDNTSAVIYDETTSSQTVAEDFIPVFQNLNIAVEILNQQASTVNYISEQYNLLTDQHQQMLNDIIQVEQQLNGISRNIIGEAGNIAMFSGADPALGGDPLIDSSIYMYLGNVGVFTTTPSYPMQIDKNLKTKEITIENAIRDTSGNVLLGYGSPLQIGASTNARPIIFYNGSNVPVIRIDTSVRIESPMTVNGNLGVTGNVDMTGSITQNGTLVPYLTDTSLSGNFYWIGGYLKINTIDVCSGLSAAYIDGSIMYLRARDLIFNASIGVLQTTANLNLIFNASIGVLQTTNLITNASLGVLQARNLIFNASLGTLQKDKTDLTYTIKQDTSIVTQQIIYNASLGVLQASNIIYNASLGTLQKDKTDLTYTIKQDTSIVATNIIYNASIGAETLKNTNQDSSINTIWVRLDACLGSGGVVGANTIVDASLSKGTGGSFFWSGGLLWVDTSAASNDFTLLYLNASLNAKANLTYTDASLMLKTDLTYTIKQDTSIITQQIIYNASIGTLTIGLANTDASVIALNVNDGYLDISINNLDASIKLTWVKLGSVDTSLSNLGKKNGNIDTSLNTIYVKLKNVDTSLNAVNSRGATGDIQYANGTGGFSADASFNWLANKGLGINIANPSTYLDVGGTIRATKETLPLASAGMGGTGLEISYESGTGMIVPFNRNTTKYLSLDIRGYTVSLQAASTTAASLSGASMDLSSGICVFNEGSGDVDFRVESNGETDMLSINGGTNQIGFGIAPTIGRVHVDGSVYVAGTVQCVSSFIAMTGGPAATNVSYSFSGDTDTGMYRSTTNEIGFSTGGTLRFSMGATGDFDATGNVIAYSSSPSDIRLKKNVKYIEGINALDIVRKMNGVEYNLIENNDAHSGFIAQEVEKILPRVIYEKALIDKDPSILYKTIRYTEIIPYLIEAIKEQQETIENQERRINDLESKLNR